jgi:tetratricopeptide (TPR) repeat protein
MSGRDHETSYKINKGSDRYLCYIGNLDLAESCYKRAISEADCFGRIDDRMECLFELSNHVYQIWGRYDEALANYQSVLKYYDQTDNLTERSAVLRSIAEIFDSKGDDYEGMKILNEILEICKNIGNKEGIEANLIGMTLIYCRKEEYEQSINVLQDAGNVQNILPKIKEMLGQDVYQKLADKLQT